MANTADGKNELPRRRKALRTGKAMVIAPWLIQNPETGKRAIVRSLDEEAQWVAKWDSSVEEVRRAANKRREPLPDRQPDMRLWSSFHRSHWPQSTDVWPAFTSSTNVCVVNDGGTNSDVTAADEKQNSLRAAKFTRTSLSDKGRLNSIRLGCNEQITNNRQHVRPHSSAAA